MRWITEQTKMDSPYKLGASDESKVTPAGESESSIDDSTMADNEKSPLAYLAVIPSKEDRSTPAFNGQEGLLLKRPMSEPKLVPCPYRPNLPAISIGRLIEVVKCERSNRSRRSVLHRTLPPEQLSVARRRSKLPKIRLAIQADRPASRRVAVMVAHRTTAFPTSSAVESSIQVVSIVRTKARKASQSCRGWRRRASAKRQSIPASEGRPGQR